MDKIFGQQIGYINYLLKGIKIKIFKKSFKKEFFYKTITNNNYIIYKWDLSGHEVFMTDCFTDWGNEYLFLDSLKNRENNIFIDVGCHTGYYPCLLQNYFKKIIGFEPNTKSINVLKNLNIKNFIYFQNFVGDKNIEVESFETKTGWSFYNTEHNSKNISVKKIKQITLDEFCKNNDIKNITAIKIDVDGIDLEVLYGAEEIIKYNRPSIMIENYTSELFDFFEKFNYNFFTFVSTKEKPFNLKLEKIKSFEENKWVKMICCFPSEYSSKYSNINFEGNKFYGINREKILDIFNL